MTGPASRPQGVTILAIVAIVTGAFGVLGGLAALGLSAFLMVASPMAGGGLGIVAILAFLVSAASIALGVGFWLLKPWAWPAGVIIEALSAISAILSLLSGGIGSIVSLAIAAVIIWYLHQPHVRAAFGAPTAGFPLVGDRFDKYIPNSKA